MEDLWSGFQIVFSHLPLAAIVDSKLFCVHGGLSPDLTSLTQIAQLSLPIVDYFDNPMISDLIWSDPDEQIVQFADNHRGSGVLFGTAAVKEFLMGVGLRAMVRAHQCVADGYLSFAQNCGITVFSSSEYSRMQPNRAGVIQVASAGRTELFTLPADPKVEMETVVVGFWKGLGFKRFFVQNSTSFPKETGPTQNESTAVHKESAVIQKEGRAVQKEALVVPLTQPVKPKLRDRFSSKKRPVVASKRCQRTPRPSLGKVPAIPVDESSEPPMNI
jgi:diadenosine tetraphosphatase ApaH/serine/threonine PP2A family protein phosphatase